MDDTLVFSSDFDSHLAHLRIVFERLSEAGLKLRSNKCKFAVRKKHYLGHVVSKDGISLSPEKIAAVSEYPIPGSMRSKPF